MTGGDGSPAVAYEVGCFLALAPGNTEGCTWMRQEGPRVVRLAPSRPEICTPHPSGRTRTRTKWGISWRKRQEIPRFVPRRPAGARRHRGAFAASRLPWGCRDFVGGRSSDETPAGRGGRRAHPRGALPAARSQRLRGGGRGRHRRRRHAGARPSRPRPRPARPQPPRPRRHLRVPRDPAPQRRPGDRRHEPRQRPRRAADPLAGGRRLRAQALQRPDPARPHRLGAQAQLRRRPGRRAQPRSRHARRRALPGDGACGHGRAHEERAAHPVAAHAQCRDRGLATATAGGALELRRVRGRQHPLRQREPPAPHARGRRRARLRRDAPRPRLPRGGAP